MNQTILEKYKRLGILKIQENIHTNIQYLFTCLSLVIPFIMLLFDRLYDISHLITINSL